MNSSKNITLTKRALQVQRGAARAAVLGVNDGLVSILCIVLAVVGGGGSDKAVLLAGLAGLIAGAISMAVGEWISVKSQADLFSGIIDDIKKIDADDQTILDESYVKSLTETLNYSDQTAQTALQHLHSSEDVFIKAYARQVMGFNPDETGSPWLAAVSSFLLFIGGGILPLAPWFLMTGSSAVYLSVGLTAIGGLVVGGYVGLTSGKSIVRSSSRQLMIIILAAVVTYGVGLLFGMITT